MTVKSVPSVALLAAPIVRLLIRTPGGLQIASGNVAVVVSVLSQTVEDAEPTFHLM